MGKTNVKVNAIPKDVNVDYKKGLAPWVNENTKVLIIGTMPGDNSIQQQSYYLNPSNAFWKIINQLFNPTGCVKKSREFLSDLGIGLWDVYKEGVRKGSLDTGFSGNPTPNDIKGLLSQYKSIKCIVFNGHKPHDAFIKKIGKVDTPCFLFPSTSSSNTHMTFNDKLNAWAKLKDLLV